MPAASTQPQDVGQASSFLEVSLKSTWSSSQIGLTRCVWFPTQLPRTRDRKSSGTGPHAHSRTRTLSNALSFSDLAQHGGVPMANHIFHST